MGLNVKQFKDFIVRPTIVNLGIKDSDIHINLILGTAAQESQFSYLHQKGPGPALGLFQCEPATYNDIVRTELKEDAKLRQRVLSTLLYDFIPPPEALIYNLRLAVIICRLHYLRCPGEIPNTLQGQAEYYKKYYNTPIGAATVDQYIDNYRKFIGEF